MYVVYEGHIVLALVYFCLCSVSWLILAKLSVLAKWLARNTSLMMPLHGKGLSPQSPGRKAFMIFGLVSYPYLWLSHSKIRLWWHFHEDPISSFMWSCWQTNRQRRVVKHILICGDNKSANRHDDETAQNNSIKGHHFSTVLSQWYVCVYILLLFYIVSAFLCEINVYKLQTDVVWFRFTCKLIVCHWLRM